VLVLLEGRNVIPIIIGLGLVIFGGFALWGAVLDYGTWSRGWWSEVVHGWAVVAVLVVVVAVGCRMVVGVH
jgi:hypothetical protein